MLLRSDHRVTPVGVRDGRGLGLKSTARDPVGFGQTKPSVEVPRLLPGPEPAARMKQCRQQPGGGALGCCVLQLWSAVMSSPALSDYLALVAADPVLADHPGTICRQVASVQADAYVDHWLDYCGQCVAVPPAARRKYTTWLHVLCDDTLTCYHLGGPRRCLEGTPRRGCARPL